jgi:hypothetical protein
LCVRHRTWYRDRSRAALLVRPLPEFAEHVLAGPEEALGVEEDLDSDAGRPFGLGSAVVDGGETTGSEVRGNQLHALDLEVESKLVVGVGVVRPVGVGRGGGSEAGGVTVEGMIRSIRQLSL